MKKLLLLIAIVLTSCTPDVPVEKCFTVSTSGWSNDSGYYVKDPQGNVIPTKTKIQLGSTYCRD